MTQDIPLAVPAAPAAPALSSLPPTLPAPPSEPPSAPPALIPPYLSKSLGDALLPLLATSFAYRCSWVIAPSLAAWTISFFAVRLLGHTLHLLANNSSNLYACRCKMLYDRCRNQLKATLARFPRVEVITYLACFILAYLYIPTSIALSAVCGLSLGLIHPL